MGFLKHKGYSGSVEFSAEDNCLYGKVQGLRKTTILYEGMTLEELRRDFEESVDYYLASCAEREVQPEKPYSGRFVVRMTSDLHSQVADLAANTGTTINDFINRAIVHELNYERR